MSTPTVVIVPGSFVSAKLYKLFQESLSGQGVESEVVELQSVSDDQSVPPKTMSDDANEIIRVVTKLLDQGKEVVLATHSYGGIPASQSLQELSTVTRQAKGLKGGVGKIIYMTSVVVQAGVSNFDLFGDNLPPALTIKDDYMSLDAEQTANLTFSDLPFEEGLSYAKQMSYHATPSFKEKLTYAGYNDVECHYVVCESDKVIPPEYQWNMIEFLKTSTGKDVGVHKLPSDHAPTVSHRNDLASIIKQIISA